MRVERVELRDIRAYAHARVELSPGITLLVGGNAQGKTSLLEALYRVATGSSYRCSSDGPLVRHGCNRGVIRTTLRTDAGRARTVELELGSGPTRVRVDGRAVTRVGEAVGILRAVLFAPEDLGLVRGEPDLRRRFLDAMLAQRRPAYAATLADYERVLRQRNNLLRQLRELDRPARRAASPTLSAWTDQLVRHGAALTAARLAALHALAGPVDSLYRWVAGRPEAVTLRYEASAGFSVRGDPGETVPDPEPVAAALHAALLAARDEEAVRGTTLVGPHRDDLALSIGALPARSHASQGEAWSLALALKLASEQVLAEVGDRPVVLLDDVFAELDAARRQRLGEACQRWEQVVVTAAVAAEAPVDGARIEVWRDREGSHLRAVGVTDVDGAA